MAKFLKGKKILFIGMGFYDYEKAIVEELVEQGAEVDFYELLINPLVAKIAKYFPFSEEFIMKTINNNLLKKIKGSYNLVFIVKGELFRTEVLRKIKERTNAIFIMYQWDCISRLKNYQNIEPFFDYIYTFDRADSLVHKKMVFRPLFFRNEFKYINESENDKIYDVCSISSYYDYRYDFMEKICLKNKNIKSFFKLRGGKGLYLENILPFGKIKNKKIMIFRAMPLKKVVKLMSMSKTILDICDVRQAGLTMRTIETLGMQKKLITTNHDIVNYDFYNQNNVLLIDEETTILEEDFFKSPYVDISDEIYLKYSIQKWVEDVFVVLDSNK